MIEVCEFRPLAGRVVEGHGGEHTGVDDIVSPVREFLNDLGFPTRSLVGLLKDIEKHGTPAMKQLILQILAGVKEYQEKGRE